MSAISVSNYVGIPFDRDDIHPGVSCWGLVRLVLREQCSIEVPAYGEVDAGDLIKVARAMATASVLDDWREIRPRDVLEFDVVGLRPHVNQRTRKGRAYRKVTHAGIFLRGSLLHISEKTDSVMVPLQHWSVRSRIIVFYRHKDLI